jgi:hypothetical protein
MTPFSSRDAPGVKSRACAADAVGMAGVRLPFRGVALTAVGAVGFALIGAGSIALRAQFDAPTPSDAAARAARTAVLPAPAKRSRAPGGRNAARVVLRAPAPRPAPARPRRAHVPSSPSASRPATRAPQRVTTAVKPVTPAAAPRPRTAPGHDEVQLVDLTTGHVVASGAAAVDDAPTGGTVCPLDGCP